MCGVHLLSIQPVWDKILCGYSGGLFDHQGFIFKELRVVHSSKKNTACRKFLDRNYFSFKYYVGWSHPSKGWGVPFSESTSSGYFQQMDILWGYLTIWKWGVYFRMNYLVYTAPTTQCLLNISGQIQPVLGEDSMWIFCEVIWPSEDEGFFL